MSRCENCDRPLATKQDAKDIPPGEGEHLCWGACEPEDWRSRALKAEQQMRELAEVAARNVNDASHLRRTATDLEKILLREGGVEGAYERRLADALRERDEARAEVERLRFVEDCRGHGLTYECNLTRPCVTCRLRTVAERQREACAAAVGGLRVVFGDEWNDAIKRAKAAVRATPLVTEGDK